MLNEETTDHSFETCSSHVKKMKSTAHTHQFAEEKQQKLEEKAVENQAEDEVESHVDEATELEDQRTRSRW